MSRNRKFRRTQRTTACQSESPAWSGLASAPFDLLRRYSVKAGKARYIGFSNLPAWRAMKALAYSEAHGLARFESGQVYYSMVGRDIETWTGLLLTADRSSIEFDATVTTLFGALPFRIARRSKTVRLRCDLAAKI